MSQPATYTPITIEKLRGIRAKYAAGAEDIAKQITELQASRRATLGAVAALDKLIDEATTEESAPPQAT